MVSIWSSFNKYLTLAYHRNLGNIQLFIEGIANEWLNAPVLKTDG